MFVVVLMFLFKVRMVGCVWGEWFMFFWCIFFLSICWGVVRWLSLVDLNWILDFLVLRVEFVGSSLKLLFFWNLFVVLK